MLLPARFHFLCYLCLAQQRFSPEDFQISFLLPSYTFKASVHSRTSPRVGKTLTKILTQAKKHGHKICAFSFKLSSPSSVAIQSRVCTTCVYNLIDSCGSLYLYYDILLLSTICSFSVTCYAQCNCFHILFVCFPATQSANRTLAWRLRIVCFGSQTTFPWINIACVSKMFTQPCFSLPEGGTDEERKKGRVNTFKAIKQKQRLEKPAFTTQSIRRGPDIENVEDYKILHL